MLSDRICQLNVRSSTGDSRALRMGVSQLLNAVDFRPSGMPPSAILMIDKVVETMPSRSLNGAVNGLPSNNRAALAAKQQWESTLKVRLDSVYKKAIRPHKGRLSGSSKAVVFSDQAELVACLCHDIIEGSANQKWWWKRTYSEQFLAANISSALTSCLLDNTKLIPMVVDTLADWDQGISLVKRLSNNDAESLLAAVLHVFSFFGLAAKLEGVRHQSKTDNKNTSGNSHLIDSRLIGRHESIIHDASDTPIEQSPAHYLDRGYRALSDRNDDNTDQREFEKTGHYVKQRLNYPPWMLMFDAQGWERHLGRAQACLLGVARLAASKPQVLRNRVFEDQIVHWWQQTQNVEVSDQIFSGQGAETGAGLAGLQNDSIFPDTDDAVVNETDVGDSLFSSLHGLENTKKTVSNNKNKQYVSEETIDGGGEGNRMDDTVDETFRIDQVKSDGQVSSDVSITDKENDTGISEVKGVESQREAVELLDLPRNSNITDALKKCDSQNERLTEALDDKLYLQGGMLDTQLSGCFYLINLLEQLELPECMNEAWGIDRVLSRWALLELVSRSLIGDQIADFKNDSIWNLFAKLDDRNAKSRIGEQLKSYPDYNLPLDWWHYLLEHGDAANLDNESGESKSQEVEVHWAMQRETLRIWSQGCIIVERKIKLFGLDLESRNAKKYDDIKIKIVDESLQAYRKSGCEVSLIQSDFEKAPIEEVILHNKKNISPSMQRWASLTTPFIRHYLKSQLSLDSLGNDVLIDTLFQFPSRVYFTSSHIDVVAELKHTRLDVRCSGLDQNPGWLPLFGRVFQFHFSSGL